MQQPATQSIAEEYARRLTAWQGRAGRLDRWASLCSLGGLAAFLGCVMLFITFLSTGSVAWVWLIAFVLALGTLLTAQDRLHRAGERARRVVRLYELGLARLEDRWMGRGQQGREYLKLLAEDAGRPLAWLDEPRPAAQAPAEEALAGRLYAEDLDLFGKGSLYELLCQAGTPAGRDTLAAWLLAPAPPAEIRRRQEAVHELASRPALREALARAAATPWARMMPPARLAAWAEAPSIRVRAAEQVAAALLSALTLAALLTLPAWGPLPFAALLAADGLFGLSVRNRIHRIAGFAERAGHGLLTYADMLAQCERAEFRAPLLCELHAVLTGHGPAASREIRRLARRIDWFEDGQHNVALRPAVALLFGSLHLAWAIERWRGRHGRDVRRWLRALGQLEALCSLAAFAHEHPGDVFPEIVEAGAVAGGPLLEGCGLAHPLMPATRAVRNDIVLGGDPAGASRLIVLSGSNMSGKSTFLRTLGVNVMLAQAGATVRAERLRLTPLTIGSSIRNLDSLQSGVSRFYAEIERIRDIVERARGGQPLLFLIDEMLSGTNSHDRRLAAEAIVRRLVELGAIGLVTTHDLALTAIADELAPRARNAHFEDQLEDGKIRFDYRLRPGVIQRGNALELMRSIGLNV